MTAMRNSANSLRRKLRQRKLQWKRRSLNCRSSCFRKTPTMAATYSSKFGPVRGEMKLQYSLVICSVCTPSTPNQSAGRLKSSRSVLVITAASKKLSRESPVIRFTPISNLSRGLIGYNVSRKLSPKAGFIPPLALWPLWLNRMKWKRSRFERRT